MVEDWAKSLGVEELRASKTHSLVGDCTPDPTDQTVATLFDPVAMIAAQFGKVVPAAPKFVVPRQ